MSDDVETIVICALDGEACDGACDRYGVGCDPIEIVHHPSIDDTVDLSFGWETPDE